MVLWLWSSTENELDLQWLVDTVELLKSSKFCCIYALCVQTLHKYTYGRSTNVHTQTNEHANLQKDPTAAPQISLLRPLSPLSCKYYRPLQMLANLLISLGNYISKLIATISWIHKLISTTKFILNTNMNTLSALLWWGFTASLRCPPKSSVKNEHITCSPQAWSIAKKAVATSGNAVVPSPYKSRNQKNQICSETNLVDC